MPKLERKADPPKKKDKASKAPASAEVSGAATPAKRSATPAGDAQDAAAQKKEKKEKKEKVKTAEGGNGKKAAGGNGGGKAAAAEDAGEPVPSMIDLRVGHIIDGMLLHLQQGSPC